MVLQNSIYYNHYLTRLKVACKYLISRVLYTFYLYLLFLLYCLGLFHFSCRVTWLSAQLKGMHVHFYILTRNVSAINNSSNGFLVLVYGSYSSGQ